MKHLLGNGSQKEGRQEGGEREGWKDNFASAFLGLAQVGCGRIWETTGKLQSWAGFVFTSCANVSVRAWRPHRSEP